MECMTHTANTYILYVYIYICWAHRIGRFSEALILLTVYLNMFCGIDSGRIGFEHVVVALILWASDLDMLLRRWFWAHWI